MDGTNNEIGFNFSAISNLKEQIDNTENVVFTSINTHLTNLMGSVATFWFAQDAVDFGTNFKTNAENQTAEINGAFQSFRAACVSEIDAWAAETGNSIGTYDIGLSNQYSIEISVDQIKPDNAGAVYMDIALAQTFIDSGIESEKSLLMNEINNAANEFTTTAFIGGGQVDAAKACFIQIGGVIDNIFEELRTTMNEKITETKDAYTARADATLSNFQSTSLGNTSASV